MIERADIWKAMKKVIDPELRRNLVDLDMVKKVDAVDGSVSVELALTSPACPLKDKIISDVKSKVGAVPGVEKVAVETRPMTEAEKVVLGEKLRGRPRKPLSISSGTQVIGVGSGKGGVGKSTVAVNLAAALTQAGFSVGLLDADIWGFSAPRMLGVHERPLVHDNQIKPVENLGIKIMSTGFFVSEDTPVIWRGPLVHRAIEQFLTEVAWGELDYLLVDLPPGTGDVTITLAKLVPELKLVMVTTPQAAAARVAVRAGHMAHKAAVAVIGVIENMSYFICKECGRKNYLFGSGGGVELAQALGAPLLGRIPFDPLGREGSDAGEPIVIANPDSTMARAFIAVADKLRPVSEARAAQ